MTVVIGAPRRPSDAREVQFDFEHAPFLVIWEVTRACALACVHCRADAIARRDPRELTTAEGHGLVDQVCAFGSPPPLLVLTGGDPMWRKDLADLVGYAARSGLTVALTPSGTAMATRERLAELKAAGLSRVAVSLDGPDPETHDAFRRVRGSYANTLKIIEAAPGSGSAPPDQLHGESRDPRDAARDGRPGGRVPAHPLGRVLPGADRTWCEPRADHRRGGRGGARLPRRSRRAGPVRHQDHRGAPLSPRAGGQRSAKALPAARLSAAGNSARPAR